MFYHALICLHLKYAGGNKHFEQSTITGKLNSKQFYNLEQDMEIGRNTDLIGEVREGMTSNAVKIERLPSLEQMKESIGK